MNKLKSAIITGLLGGVSIYRKDNKVLIHRQAVTLTSYLFLSVTEVVSLSGGLNNLIVKINSKGYKHLKNSFIVFGNGKQELGRIQVTPKNRTRVGWVVDDLQKRLEQYSQVGCEGNIVEDFY